MIKQYNTRKTGWVHMDPLLGSVKVDQYGQNDPTYVYV